VCFFLLTELQDNLKAQACKPLVDAELLQKSLIAIAAASEDVLVEEPKLPSMEEVLFSQSHNIVEQV